MMLQLQPPEGPKVLVSERRDKCTYGDSFHICLRRQFVGLYLSTETIILNSCPQSNLHPLNQEECENLTELAGAAFFFLKKDDYLFISFAGR